MKVTEVAFTGYPVTDIARARSFYEDVLKLEHSRTFESPNGFWISDPDGNTIIIHKRRPR
ncbi:MAG TPA: VOC family protein [Chthoniobacterales bacterium]|nr:VOC family protein [Chthoniobacterales bacterium]